MVFALVRLGLGVGPACRLGPVPGSTGQLAGGAVNRLPMGRARLLRGGRALAHPAVVQRRGAVLGGVAGRRHPEVRQLEFVDAVRQGSWYRCCGGHVRQLRDCCGYTRRRINGDAALTGYCYHGRHVFCVMYYDTKIKC